MIVDAVGISGKDSITTAMILREKYPDKDFLYFFNDTGLELPEVDAWLSLVEKKLGKEITRLNGDLMHHIESNGFWPSSKMRYCTRLAKIYPMEDYFKQYEQVNLYLGLRYDERHRAGYQPNKKINIVPHYPLIEDKINLQMVWVMCEAWGVMPPLFEWKELKQRVIDKLHDAGLPPHFIETLKPWEVQTLFSWRSRPNCYNCFYQRLYEFVGLLHHHPDLYWKMADDEDRIGGAGYTIKQNWGLKRIAKNADKILSKRVDSVVNQLTAIYRAQNSLFDFEPDDDLSVVSCGLFCGK